MEKKDLIEIIKCTGYEDCQHQHCNGLGVMYDPKNERYTACLGWVPDLEQMKELHKHKGKGNTSETENLLQALGCVGKDSCCMEACSGYGTLDDQIGLRRCPGYAPDSAKVKGLVKDYEKKNKKED